MSEMQEKDRLSKFLEEQQKNNGTICIIVQNGYQMRGTIVDWDDKTICIEELKGNKVFVFWNAISTIKESSTW